MISMEPETARFFKESIETIAEVKKDGFIQFNEDGIKIEELENNNIRYVTIKIPNSMCDEYRIEKPVKIAIDFKELLVFLKRWKKTYIDIEWDTTKEIPTEIFFKYPETKRTFKLMTIEIEKGSPKPPELCYPTEISVNKKEIKNAIQDFHNFADKLRINVEDTLKIKGLNYESANEMEIEVDIQNENRKEKGNICCMSYDKISDVIKKILEEELIIKHGQDMPLDIGSHLMDASLEILIAPRIETEE